MEPFAKRAGFTGLEHCRTIEEAAAHVGLSVQSIKRKVGQGIFPPGFRMGRRHWWTVETLDAYVASVIEGATQDDVRKWVASQAEGRA